MSEAARGIFAALVWIAKGLVIELIALATVFVLPALWLWAGGDLSLHHFFLLAAVVAAVLWSVGKRTGGRRADG